MEWIRYINAFWCLKDEFVQKLFHHLLTPMKSFKTFLGQNKVEALS